MENLIEFCAFYILYSTFMYIITYEDAVNSCVDIIALLIVYVILTIGLLDVTITKLKKRQPPPSDSKPSLTGGVSSSL